MKREFLKNLGLPDEQIDSIMGEHGATVNGLRKEVDDFKDEIAKRDGQIQTLEKTAGNSEDLQKELDRVKGENATWQDKYSKSQLQANVKLAAAKDANDVNDILYFVDMESLKLNEDGSVDGLQDQLKNLKETKPYLFNTSSQQELSPAGGQDDPPPGGTGYVPGSHQTGNKPKPTEEKAKAAMEESYARIREKKNLTKKD